MVLEQKKVKMEEHHWYAAKVFFNKTAPIVSYLQAYSVRFYLPSDIIPSLLFLYVTSDALHDFQSKFYDRLWIYSDRLTHRPSAIPDREMQLFIFVTSAGKKGLIYLGEDRPEYHIGDRVRVTSGPFKGAEGHIKRIKKDRRLIITISGIAAVATTFIHPSLLEPITE